MSVSFCSNLTANQRLAFKSEQKKSSHSYLNSGGKGALVGGIIGTGVATAAKKIANLEVPIDSVALGTVTKTAENLLGENPVRKFTFIGAVIGAIALTASVYKNKRSEAEAEKLKPIS